MRLGKFATALAATALLALGGVGSAIAQATAKGAQKGPTVDINRNTVSVITGTPSGTYLQIAYDMSAVLDDGDNMRVLPIVGKGSVQNIKDILHLKGVDMGIIQSDVMGYFRQSGELGRDLGQKLVYIAKLYNEEVHIVAGREIKSIADLAGKKVNFAEVGSGTQYSGRFLFKLLNVAVAEVNMGQADALLKVKSGEIAATLFVAGRPASAIKSLAKDPDLKLLPVPFSQPLENDYFPSQFTSDDYPNLIATGEKVETIAVGAVLAAFNWSERSDRRRRIGLFVERMFGKIAELQKAPRHPKWKEVNLAARLPGWSREASAAQWLARQAQRADAPAASLVAKAQ